MADEEITDAELAAELRQYGEEVKLPLKSIKRQVLLKKLNHLKARSNAQNSKQSAKSSLANSSRSPRSSPIQVNRRDGHTLQRQIEPSNSPSSRTAFAASPQLNDSRTRRYSANLDHTQTLNGDGLKSDDTDADSDVEHAAESSLSYLSFARSNKLFNSSSSSNSLHGQSSKQGNSTARDREIQEKKRSSQLTDSVFRTLRRRTVEPPQRPQKSHVLEVSTEKSRSSRSLNESSDGEIAVPSPARSKLYSGVNNVSSFLSRPDDNRFESSDSDLDEGTSGLAVESKRHLNNSLPIGHHSGRHDSSRTEYLSSNKSSSYLNSSNEHHPRIYPWRRNYLNGHHRVQQYRSWYLEILPHVLIGVAVIFFISLSVTYIVIHKDFFFSWFSSSSNMGKFLFCYFVWFCAAH